MTEHFSWPMKASPVAWARDRKRDKRWKVKQRQTRNQDHPNSRVRSAGADYLEKRLCGGKTDRQTDQKVFDSPRLKSVSKRKKRKRENEGKREGENKGSAFSSIIVLLRNMISFFPLFSRFLFLSFELVWEKEKEVVSPGSWLLFLTGQRPYT